jgi:hypothetical protein
MNYNIRSTDPQATVQGRTFAVRATYNGGMTGAPEIMLVEKRNGDWVSVGQGSEVLLFGSNFDAEEGTVAFLKKVVDWLNTNFARLIGSAVNPVVPAGSLYGDGGRIDQAIQRIQLVVTGDTIAAKL